MQSQTGAIMTETFILYVIMVILFLGLDAVGLSYLIRPTFEKDIGPLLRDSPHWGAALVFYLFYVVGLLWFVAAPAMRAETGLMAVFLTGALFGAVAYATYEFSNMATLNGWTWRMLLTDLTWGTVLTGVTAAGGVVLTRAVT